MKATLDLVTLFVTKNKIKGNQSVPPATLNNSSQRGSVSSVTSISQSHPKSDSKTQNNSTGMNQSRDADYLSAVKRGDMETAQRMVDETAKERYNNLGSQTQKMLLYFRGLCGTINTDYLTGGILYDHQRRYHRRRT